MNISQIIKIILKITLIGIIVGGIFGALAGAIVTVVEGNGLQSCSYRGCRISRTFIYLATVGAVAGGGLASVQTAVSLALKKELEKIKKVKKESSDKKEE